MAKLFDESKSGTWKERCSQLENLDEIVEHQCPEGATKEQLLAFVQKLSSLHLPYGLCAQIRDLRSAVVKVACSTVSRLAAALGRHIDPLSPKLTATLLSLIVPPHPLVVRTAASAAINALLTSSAKGLPNALPRLLDGCATQGNARLRCRSVELLHSILAQWDVSVFAQSAGFSDYGDPMPLASAVINALSDSLPETRQAGSRCLEVLVQRLPAAADAIKSKISAKTRRMIGRMEQQPAAGLPKQSKNKAKAAKKKRKSHAKSAKSEKAESTSANKKKKPTPKDSSRDAIEHLDQAPSVSGDALPPAAEEPAVQTDVDEEHSGAAACEEADTEEQTAPGVINAETDDNTALAGAVVDDESEPLVQADGSEEKYAATGGGADSAEEQPLAAQEDARETTETTETTAAETETETAQGDLEEENNENNENRKRKSSPVQEDSPAPPCKKVAHNTSEIMMGLKRGSNVGSIINDGQLLLKMFNDKCARFKLLAKMHREALAKIEDMQGNSRRLDATMRRSSLCLGAVSASSASRSLLGDEAESDSRPNRRHSLLY